MTQSILVRTGLNMVQQIDGVYQIKDANNALIAPNVSAGLGRPSTTLFSARMSYADLAAEFVTKFRLYVPPAIKFEADNASMWEPNFIITPNNAATAAAADVIQPFMSITDLDLVARVLQVSLTVADVGSGGTGAFSIMVDFKHSLL